MIIQKFEEQVKKVGEKLAIVTENKKLTYIQLNNYANGIANTISEQDSLLNKKIEDPVVGLLFGHSADMIVGVLGTLKVNKIYVPMDITYPQNRLEYMLENSETYLILTNNMNLPLAERLIKKVNKDIILVNIDSIDQTIPYPDFQREPAGDRKAYILYTSGSTGNPKGVLQNHNNVCYYIRNWTERFSITSADRMTLFSAFSHDGAGQDMFGALHNGATLYPYNILSRANIAELAQWLIDEEITIWHSVPTLYRYFVDTLQSRKIIGRHFPHLRFILLGGEQIREHDLDMFKRFFPNSKFANVYGQTESSVNSIWTIGVDDPIKKMLIGAPLDKTKLLIVNKEGTVVEDLGTGEIVVACPHLALGYWKDEQAGKNVFLQHPQLGPFYKTGDLGRLMADGNIEILGRKDNQVKIRGFRIEVGEIETRLLNHEAIKEAVVIARDDNRNNAHLYAYYVQKEQKAEETGNPVLTVSALREYLSRELPEHMIPSFFIELEQMPLTPNGKVDRKRLPEPVRHQPQLGVTYLAPETDIEKQISDIWREVLQVQRVGINDNFFDLGGTSFDILRITSKIYEKYQKDIPVISIFQYPTVHTFVEYMNRTDTEGKEHIDKGEEGKQINEEEEDFDIAVIGASGKFPGCNNLSEFWENLKNGVESIAFFSKEELEEEHQISNPKVESPNYIKARGVVKEVDYFDAGFFNFTPGEAQIMDPQLRIMHELSWEAMENAGYVSSSYDGMIGIYAGNAANHYWVNLTMLNTSNIADTGFLINNYSTIVSYKLNLRGPSFILQCACSTSLVAIHLACTALKKNECQMALAGGVSIWMPNKNGYMYQEGMIHSRDGHCRTFDANASGTIFSNGAGMILLKTLNKAISDGDNIWAVIKGTGVNNDGNRKTGLPSPSIEGQAEIISKVYRESNIDPESIHYIEAHGTATVLGDPVELEALKLAFNTKKRQYCRIGSVKANIGHLNIAAGIAGFLKAVLTLKNRQIPPSVHYRTPNPKFDFENSPFLVNTRLYEWEKDQYPLRAGISSFGIGGTNAHIIIEEPPRHSPSSASRDLKMLFLSGRTQSALQSATTNLAEYLKENPGINLADVAYTLQNGRRNCKKRRMILCNDVTEAIDLLNSAENAASLEEGKIQSSPMEEGNRPVIFMFPGQGAQYVDMGKGLYQSEPVFRHEMDRCFEILKPLTTVDIKQILFPMDTENENNSEQSEEEQINQTEITQPLIFIIEYALAKSLMHWGIKPYAMIGHSIGEYTAACLSGVFSLEDVLKVVTLRGRLMQQLPTGSMLSVPLPEEKLLPLIKAANTNAQERNKISMAAVNTTAYCVVSGTHEAINKFETHLQEKNIEYKSLHTSHAFHSVMMEPILEEFSQTLSSITMNKPIIPYISNLKGKWITVEDATDSIYWARHLRETVRYADGLDLLLKDADNIFLEVGPGRSLTTFVRQHKNKKTAQVNLNLIRHPKEKVSDTRYLFSRVGRFWLNGGKIDWRGFYSEETRHRIPLPTYPFEKRRYRLEVNINDYFKNNVNQKNLSTQRLEMESWFYTPIWRTQTSAAPLMHEPETDKSSPTENWLIFCDEYEIGNQLSNTLRELGHYVIIVYTGTGFVKTGDYEYTINPSDAEEYDALLKEYCDKGKIPTRILHLWNVTGDDEEEQDYLWIQESGYFSLLHLAQAIGRQSWSEPLQIYVITNQVHAITGKEKLEPSKASILGAAQVIPREYPNIKCHCIDFEMPAAEKPEDKTLINKLINEITSQSQETVIALRDNYRWVKNYEPVTLEPPAEKSPRLKQEGVYLITGGLGGIGLVMAEYMARTLQARLILIGRTPLPPRSQWQKWLETHEPSEKISQKIKQILQLEELGAKVLMLSADVADMEQMKNLVKQALDEFGEINGVIHAAGIPDGGLIQRRDREMSEQVFASKITGTLILDELLKDEKLDFFILCSSINAVTTPMGQVAYCAANIFMDNFAYFKTLTQQETYSVSINWDAWREVGMAVEAIKKLSPTMPQENSVPQVQSVDYPIFTAREIIDPQQTVYISRLRADKCWLLDEHRIRGQATIPGTGYLEIGRAAVEHHTGQSNIELKEFFTLAPLIVKEDEEKEIRTIIKKENQIYNISFISRHVPGEDKWIEHARGKATIIDKPSPKNLNIKEIQQSCNMKEIVYPPEEYTSEHGTMTFGPRWNNLRLGKFAEKQALGLIELPQEFSDDIGVYKLHPALLDVGNVVLRRIDENSGTYAPVFYKQLRIMGTLPQKTWFHVKAAESNKPNAEILRYDITIMDEQGKELVDIKDYTLRKVSFSARTVQQFDQPIQKESIPKKGADIYRPYSAFVTLEGTSYKRQPEAPANDPLKDAISPQEGIEVFLRVIAKKTYPQVVVSTYHLPTRLEIGRKSEEKEDNETSDSNKQGTSVIKEARPELSSEYIAPESNIQKQLSVIWQDLLGIEKIGIYDDFFELGGDSLKAVNFGARIHKELKVEVPITEFFNRPTIKELVGYIEQNSEISEFHALAPAEKKEYYPLSPSQRRLYILNRLEGKHVAYNLPDIAVLKVPIEFDRLQDVFLKLIDRHESLRTSFAMIQGDPVQRIHDNVNFEIEFHEINKDINKQIPGEKEIIRKFVRPFDLSRAPLMRAGLIKKSPQEYILLLDFHHIIFDGTSFPLFYKGMLAQYEGEELAPIKNQYKDFVVWKNRPENIEIKNKQESFWLKTFSGDIPILQLPLDYQRPPLQNFEGSTLDWVLEKDETKALKDLAKMEEATTFMVILAALNILLMKLSSQEDIIVGSIVSGRTHADIEPVIGAFINTLPLRNYPATGKSIRVFLKELKQNTLNAFENQEYPFEDLVNKTAVNRDMSRNPLFDVLFILNNEIESSSKYSVKQGNLELNEYIYQKPTSQFDLSFIGYERGEWLTFEIEYCTRLFKKESIERFIEIFHRIIRFMVKHPDKRINEIDILPEEEKEQILFEFNQTEADYSKGKTLHQLIQEQATKSPHYISLTGRDQTSKATSGQQENRYLNEEIVQITYQELIRRADRIAFSLKKTGTSPGTLVGIMLERSLPMITGLLGILKSGAAYLPLDPEYPAARIRYIIENSNTHLLLTQNKLVGNRQDINFPGKIIDIYSEEMIETLPDEEEKKKESIEKSDYPAYVIYTSGSTGNPKGVIVTHQNAINFIKGITSRIEFNSGKTILALTTVSFDIFFLETLLPLTCGLKLALATEDHQKDPVMLAKLLQTNQVDIMQLTPSRLQLLLDFKGNLQLLTSVKSLLVGGEAFPPQLLNRLKEHFHGKIFNMYGPTETTIWSMVKELTHSTPDTLTIGTPLANNRIYIVNRDMKLQPLGIPGELLIGGDGVAKGYLNNIELTDEKFVKFPVKNNSSTAELSGERLYRTGDYAKWLTNGEVGFLGRIDQQVKIRGFRVELDEIEEQLLKHQFISDAVVVFKTDKKGEQSLCAYVVPQKTNAIESIDATELRQRLSTQLPHYMIPTFIVPIEKIPLTPNGKIDRRALPEPELSNSSRRTAITLVEPTGSNEKTIAQIWKELLFLEDVSIYDNFFDLGGNSMKVIQLSLKIQESFGLEIPLAKLFRNLTIDFLSRYISEEEKKKEKIEKEMETMENAQNTLKETFSKLIG